MPQERQKLIIYTPQGSAPPQSSPQDVAPQRIRRRLSSGERLLRNSAIACSLLLGLLSLRNIDHPWAQAASSSVEKALTIDFDVDETLGELQFVKRFLPESTLVFWNLSGADRLLRPVEGVMLHDFSDQQPWYTFAAGHGDEIVSVKSGVLSSAVHTDYGDWIIEIDHQDGTKSIFGYVQRGTISTGESVSGGEVIASAALQGCIYFEYQRDGIPVKAEGFHP